MFVWLVQFSVSASASALASASASMKIVVVRFVDADADGDAVLIADADFFGDRRKDVALNADAISASMNEQEFIKKIDANAAAGNCVN